MKEELFMWHQDRFPLGKVLVTGGAGFIGSHLVEALVEMGIEVVVADTLATGKRANLASCESRICFLNADIRNLEEMRRCCRGCGAVFHLAAVVSVPQSVADPLESATVNDLGALTVLEAARQEGVRRVVLSSSSAVYGDAPELPKRESMPIQSMSPYALQKWIDEKWADLYHRLYGLETVSLRYFNVFGPRQDPSSVYSGVISIFMEKALSGNAPVIYGDGSQTRDFVFVRDVVKANLLAAANPKAAGKVFNIATGVGRSVNGIWETIAHLAGSALSPGYGPERPGDVRHSVADIRLAAEQLGFVPEVDFDAGISLTHRWYEAHRPMR